VAKLVRIVLAVWFLLAHTPVCKGAVLSLPAPSDSPRPTERPPCCAKCVKNAAPTHTQSPKPRTPAKPTCPTDTACVLCGAAAVILTVCASLEPPAPVVGRLAEFGPAPAAAGFRALLDRPPRALRPSRRHSHSSFRCVVMAHPAADLGALSVSRTTPTASALRHPRRWGSRVVVPLALVGGFAGLVLWASWDTIVPPVPVKIVPVRTQSGTVEVVGQELFRANGWVEPRP
jgi:hypothetical protein